MSPQTILDYWFPNGDYTNYQEFWFDTTPDAYIRDNFSDLLSELSNPLSPTHSKWISSIEGQLATIIVLDQFTRNIYRGTDKIHQNDPLAYSLANKLITQSIDLTLPLAQRIFLLFPLRHRFQTKELDRVIERINLYAQTYPLEQYKLLAKFRMGTIQSYTKLTDGIILTEPLNPLDLSTYSDVLDPITQTYEPPTLKPIHLMEPADPLVRAIISWLNTSYPNIPERIIGLSLSGGVDSMVILYILKQLEVAGIIRSVISIHLEYSNREEAHRETELLVAYAGFLQTPLYVRTIGYMNRLDVDRAFYELETKTIRFNTYRFLSETTGAVGFCLGHHSGDLAENVLMNVFNNRDILDLLVMEPESDILGVKIFRPLLSNPKKLIYEFAHKYSVPYFNDSTPDWSSRGVIRRKILPELAKQFGPGISDNLIKFGTQSSNWAKLIDRSIINPIKSSITIKPHGFIIKFPNSPDLNIELWTKILTDTFHELHVGGPSKKNMEAWVSSASQLIGTLNKFKFSNGYIGLFFGFDLVVCKNWDLEPKLELMDINIPDCPEQQTIRLNNWDIVINYSPLLDNSQHIRNPITWSSILDGSYTYTEIVGNRLHLVNKFESKDMTYKLFVQLNQIRNSIPKITSGLVNKQNGKYLATINISYKN